jgi:DNA-binding NarL/FixJ family response regulator
MLGELLGVHFRALDRGNAVEVAGSVAEAVAALGGTRVDCLVVTPALGGEDAFRLVAPARSAHAGLRVVVLAAAVEEFTLIAMERLGLTTLVDCARESLPALAEALQAAAAGRDLVTRRFLVAREAWRADDRAAAKRLSPRQCEVLALIGLGLGDEAIASRLGLKSASVKWHRSEIMRRISIGSTAQLIRYAAERGVCRGVGAA